MTVTIHFRSGTTDVYTNATFTIVGDVVTVTGTAPDGTTGEFSYHWSDIIKIIRS